MKPTWFHMESQVALAGSVRMWSERAVHNPFTSAAASELIAAH